MDQDAPKPRGRPRKDAKPFEDFSLLSPDEQAAIEAEAQATVHKEATEASRKAFLKKAVDAERRKQKLTDPDDEIESLVIDLPAFADRITLDGTMYMHGSVVQVTRDVARTLKDQMARSWDHENEIGGAHRDHYRAPKKTLVNGRTGAVMHGKGL